MRPDVKLGVVISAVFVLVAGGYYLYHGEQEIPVPVVVGSEVLSDPEVSQSPASIPKEKPQTVVAEGLGSGGDPPRGAAPEQPAPRENRTASVPQRSSTPSEDPDREAGALAQGNSNAPVRTDPVVSRQDEGPSSGRVARMGRGRAEESVERGAERVDPRAPGAGRGSSRRAVALAAAAPDRGQGAASSPGEGQAAMDTHRVQQGDTLSSLAVAYYGSASFTHLLVEANPNLADPDRLKVGAIVKIPPRPQAGDTQPQAELSPSTPPGASPAQADDGRRTYAVKPGDSFYRIARDILGDASRWMELFELNKGLVGGDPTHLRVGHVLVLPER